jgi:hypothetical protein
MNASKRDIQHIRPFARSAHATICSTITQPPAMFHKGSLFYSHCVLNDTHYLYFMEKYWWIRLAAGYDYNPIWLDCVNTLWKIRENWNFTNGIKSYSYRHQSWRWGQDWSKTGAGLGKDWGRDGARLKQDWGKTGTRLGQDWGRTRAGLGQGLGQDWNKTVTRLWQDWGRIGARLIQDCGKTRARLRQVWRRAGARL